MRVGLDATVRFLLSNMELKVMGSNLWNNLCACKDKGCIQLNTPDPAVGRDLCSVLSIFLHLYCHNNLPSLNSVCDFQQL